MTTSVYRRRTVAALIPAALATTGLAACSGNASDSSTTTVSYLSWDSEQLMRPLIDDFEAQHPDIEIEFSWAPPVAEYIQTLQTRVSAGTAPDVFIITAENRTQIMEAGAAADLAGEPFMSNIADTAKATYTKDGAVYGMATNSWGGGIVYNEELLQEAGITAPFDTWEEFVDACHTLKDSGVKPYLDSIDSVPVLLSAMLGQENVRAGGKMDEEIFDGTSSFADTWTEPLTRYQGLVDDGILDQSAVALAGDQVVQEFAAGRVAMISTGSWTPGTIRDAAPDLRFRFIAVPGMSEGDGYWAGAVSPGFAISSESENKDAALAFLEFMQSAKTLKAYNEATGVITTTKDFTPRVDDSLTDMSEAVRAGDFYLPMSSWPRAQDALQTQATALLQQMVQGSITPEQVASGMDDELAKQG